MDTEPAALIEAEVDADIYSSARRRPASTKGFTTSQAALESATDSNAEYGEATPLLIDSDAADEEDEETARSRLPWNKRPSAYWLLGPFCMIAMAYGGIIVPKLNLVLGLICRDHYNGQPSLDTSPSANGPFTSTDPRCRVPEVQTRVTAFKLGCTLISGIIAAVIAPKLGALSDRYGRTPLIAFAVSGMTINELFTVLAAKFPQTVSVNWILLGSVFDGLSGSFVALMAIAHGYAADCTPSHRRGVIFGYFHGGLFSGVAIGPVAAGYLVKKTGDTLSVFYLAVTLFVIFILMLLFIIPESLPKLRQQANRTKHRASIDSAVPVEQKWRSWLEFFNVFGPLKILTGPSSSPAIRRNLMALATIDFIIFGIAMGAAMVVLLYSNFKFGWDQWEQSKFTSIVNSCRVSCLLLVLPALTRWYRPTSPTKKPATRRNVLDEDSPSEELEGTDPFELSVLRFAILAEICGFLGYALSDHGPAFILSGAITSVGGIGSPTLQAAMTKHVPRDNIGQLLGAVGLLHALARVLGPTVFGGIYAMTVGVLPQLYFLILAATYALAFCITWLVQPNYRLVPRVD